MQSKWQAKWNKSRNAASPLYAYTRVLTVGIFSIWYSCLLTLWIWVQIDLIRSFVLEDSVLVPRNRTITLVPFSSLIHSGNRDAIFAINEVLPDPGSPHITTGDLKWTIGHFKFNYCRGIYVRFSIGELAISCNLDWNINKLSRYDQTYRSCLG